MSLIWLILVLVLSCIALDCFQLSLVPWLASASPVPCWILSHCLVTLSVLVPGVSSCCIWICQLVFGHHWSAHLTLGLTTCILISPITSTTFNLETSRLHKYYKPGLNHLFPYVEALIGGRDFGNKGSQNRSFVPKHRNRVSGETHQKDLDLLYESPETSGLWWLYRLYWTVC